MLSQKAKDVLEIAMAAVAEAKELSEAIDTPSAVSKETEYALAVALASKELAKEMVAVVAAGSGSLSKKAKDALEIAMTVSNLADEVINEIES